jgi:sugar fermentation stimulation protein A
MLYEYNNTITAICINRPSKICKSPYVADIEIEGESFLAHSPALGMDGYISRGKTVLVSALVNPKGACKYSILAAYDENSNVYVGANPIHANKAFHEACKQNLINEDFGTISKIVPEHTHGNSRFDFYLDDEIYVEVKSVLISRDNIAYFPVGNKKKGTISERANKHISELSDLCLDGNACALVFMVLREDVSSFTPNVQDSIFCECIKTAFENGVRIYAYQCKVDTHGISFIGKLPIKL